MLRMTFCFLSIIFLSFATSLFSVKASDDTFIDISKVKQGVITVHYPKKITAQAIVVVEKDNTSYKYSLKNDNQIELPLQMGSGEYIVTLYESVSKNLYKVIISKTIEVEDINENELYTNAIQLISFNKETNYITETSELVVNASSQMEIVTTIYNYVIDNIKYDIEKTKNIENNYIPILNDIFNKKAGICYDYSSVFAAILRYHGIPTKLIMGYSENVSGYHAWNEVLIDGSWIIIDTACDSVLKANKINFEMLKDISLYTTVKTY